MNILFVNGIYAPRRCGVSHYTLRLREQLRQRGVSTRVITTRAAAQQAAAAGDADVLGGLPAWRMRYLPALVRRLNRLAPEIDALHIQYAQTSFRYRRSVLWLPLLLRATGWNKPILTTLHEYGSQEERPALFPGHPQLVDLGEREGWWDREGGFLTTLSDWVVSTNARTNDLLRERLPGLNGRVHTIPLAMTVEVAPLERAEARARLRAGFGWKPGAPVIVFFGFIHAVKGLDTLLRAFRDLLARCADARLLIIGGTDALALEPEDARRYFAALRQMVCDLGLEGTAVFTGYLENRQVSEYLQGADIGVLPFNHGVDLKSGSLLALLAHGLPTVVTRFTPPVPELEDQQMALVIDRKEPDQLTDALWRLLDHPDLSARMAVNGLVFSQRFGWEEVAEEHLRLYEDAAGRAARRFG